MYIGLGLSQETEINEYMYVGLGLSQEKERPKDKSELSKPLEPLVYLVLPFSFNSFPKIDAEINLFAFLLTSTL